MTTIWHQNDMTHNRFEAHARKIQPCIEPDWDPWPRRSSSSQTCRSRARDPWRSPARPQGNENGWWGHINEQLQTICINKKILCMKTWTDVTNKCNSKYRSLCVMELPSVAAKYARKSRDKVQQIGCQMWPTRRNLHQPHWGSTALEGCRFTEEPIQGDHFGVSSTVGSPQTN